MPVRCYGQSWYKYRIHTGACVLICRDLRDQVVDGGGWSDLHTGWTKVHLSITQPDQTKNLGGNLTHFSNRYRYRCRYRYRYTWSILDPYCVV